MYKSQRVSLKGTPLARHSMNQKVMKRVQSRANAFYREDATGGKDPPPMVSHDTPLFDKQSLAKLVRTGVYGDGPTAELAAITHNIGSILNRVRPLQTASQN